MIYDRGTPGNGEWHCPFSREWVERMKRAVKHCERLSAEYIERVLNHETLVFRIPKGDVLNEEQDVRGLPLSWCREEERRFRRYPTCCTAVYDYDSIPETVITNGEEDWPLNVKRKVLTA